MLELKNLTKKYGDNLVLNDINFTFDKGVYGLLGANGAGKSTLMNLITDNIKRTDGSIFYNGTDILELGAKFRKKVGYTPQLQGMYEDFTARAFLHYIGTLKGMKFSECKAQTEEFLEVVGLLKVAHKRLGSFSGGMRQRVLIAAAMLDRPEILILDEPTAGLDPEERIRLRNYIADISRDRTIILATHVVSDIESIAGSVIMLCKGKPAAVGSPAELIAGVKDKVSEFCGSYEEISALKADYGKGQIYQTEKGYILRIVSDERPEGFSPVSGGVDLEDVYLYYAEGRK
ncbi:MAG: ATP-binding cassette domain-containing protein [Oscillospiraceae bacterium]|nr:ATP-binding cassette domain-containing protein [Oscillospiraceae bacterium]